MRIVKIKCSSDRVIRGLISEAEEKRLLIIHFHGFGSDCFANDFLNIMHTQFPKQGISFLSVNTRYSGYLIEEYSEKNVSYGGASIENYKNVENDINSIVKYYYNQYDYLILQGHSFGTNLVKLFLRKNNSVMPAILLSPADSVGLYDSWRQNKHISNIDYQASAYVIRNDIFGMKTDYGEYQIPITYNSLMQLITSEIFNEWSMPLKPINNKCLVVKGSKDMISNYGTTKNRLNNLLTNYDYISIDGAKHIFSGYEDKLFRKILSWVQNVF